MPSSCVYYVCRPLFLRIARIVSIDQGSGGPQRQNGEGPFGIVRRAETSITIAMTIGTVHATRVVPVSGPADTRRRSGGRSAQDATVRAPNTSGATHTLELSPTRAWEAEAPE